MHPCRLAPNGAPGAHERAAAGTDGAQKGNQTDRRQPRCRSVPQETQAPEGDRQTPTAEAGPPSTAASGTQMPGVGEPPALVTVPKVLTRKTL
jgi:hypothetical protein